MTSISCYFVFLTAWKALSITCWNINIYSNKATRMKAFENEIIENSGNTFKTTVIGSDIDCSLDLKTLNSIQWILCTKRSGWNSRIDTKALRLTCFIHLRESTHLHKTQSKYFLTKAQKLPELRIWKIFCCWKSKCFMAQNVLKEFWWNEIRIDIWKWHSWEWEDITQCSTSGLLHVFWEQILRDRWCLLRLVMQQIYLPGMMWRPLGLTNSWFQDTEPMFPCMRSGVGYMMFCVIRVMNLTENKP